MMYSILALSCSKTDWIVSSRKLAWLKDSLSFTIPVQKKPELFPSVPRESLLSIRSHAARYNKLLKFELKEAFIINQFAGMIIIFIPANFFNVKR